MTGRSACAYISILYVRVKRRRLKDVIRLTLNCMKVIDSLFIFISRSLRGGLNSGAAPVLEEEETVKIRRGVVSDVITVVRRGGERNIMYVGS